VLGGRGCDREVVVCYGCILLKPTLLAICDFICVHLLRSFVYGTRLAYYSPVSTATV
jgi:hypothetical protein